MTELEGTEWYEFIERGIDINIRLIEKISRLENKLQICSTYNDQLRAELKFKLQEIKRLRVKLEKINKSRCLESKMTDSFEETEE